MRTIILLTIFLLFSLPIAIGTVQIYPTALGKVQIDMPYTLVPDEGWTSNGYSLRLGLKQTPREAFPNIKWTWVMDIVLVNNLSSDIKSLEDLTTYVLGNISNDLDHIYDVKEMLTNDRHRMLFYTITSKKKPDSSEYYALIDYQKEKNCVVVINALSERYWYGPITFGKIEFQDLCKSFAFINESQ